MCYDGYDASDNEIVGECPECSGPVDGDGNTTEAGCNWSPRCRTCGYSPCDDSC